MKRAFCAFLALVMVFGLVGCESITDWHEGTQATRPTYVYVPPVEDVPEEELFTVTLMINGTPITENETFYQMLYHLTHRQVCY